MLTVRLKKLASLIEPHHNVADIGTDHAYLPIHLAKSGHSRAIIATDVAKGPLSKASANIIRLGLAERISLRMGNGLEPIKPGEVDTVIIAGMGGLLICDIMQSGITVLEKCNTILLQPMTTPYILREFLNNNGYIIEDEVLVKEGFRIYSIMKVCKGTQIIEDPLYYYVSKPMIQNGGVLLYEYVGRIRREFEKIAKNLLKSCDKQESMDWYLSMIKKLKTIEGD